MKTEKQNSFFFWKRKKIFKTTRLEDVLNSLESGLVQLETFFIEKTLTAYSVPTSKSEVAAFSSIASSTAKKRISFILLEMT